MPESAVWSSVWDRNFGGHIPTVQGLRQGCVFLRVLRGFRSGKSSVGPLPIALWPQRSEIPAVALMQTHMRGRMFPPASSEVSDCSTAQDTSLAPEV